MDEEQNVGGGANSKKRARQLENSLLKGDLSAITHNPQQHQFIKAHSSQKWDDNQYQSDKGRQAHIQQAALKVSGLTKGPSGTGPSRVQKNKHHISAQVVAAAEAELELEERRARGQSNKASRQERYGF
jgi:hypothetical protein